MVEPDRLQMKIEDGAETMRFACRITKATVHTHTHTHTLRMCNTYYFSAPTMATRTRLSVTLYVHCVSGLKHFTVSAPVFAHTIKYV